MPYRSALSQCLTVASAAEAPQSAQGLQRSKGDTAAYCSIYEVFAVLIFTFLLRRLQLLKIR